MDNEKKDWRIGLSCRAKFRNSEYYYDRGEIIEILPSGTGGVIDKNGILKVKLSSGIIILSPADLWVTV